MFVVSRLRRWLRRRAIYLLIFLSFFAVYFFTYRDSSSSHQPIPIKNIIVVGKDDMNGISRKSRVFSTGCTVPKLETFGAEMMPFIKKAAPLDCLERAGSVNWVHVDNQGKLKKIKKRANAVCQIGYVVRKSDYENELGKVEIMVEGQKMKQDFGLVFCADGQEEWQGLLMSVARDEKIVKRKKKQNQGKKPLDVVIFGFDSMSQQHFRRKMPKTMKQLEQMGAVTMNGFNILGDGTPQAFIPMLTGKTELELPNTRRRYAAANFVDVYPFIWKNFSDQGYVTLFGEDCFAIGMFTYRLKGFNKQPTDHYTHYFYREIEGQPINYKKHDLCLGSEPNHEAWFRYSRQFLDEYSDLPKFLLMHQGTLSHDDVNKIEVEDEYLADYFLDLENGSRLDNAILIILADHGHRFMKIRDTHQGQLEERLPMFSVVLPKKLRSTRRGQQMYKNLMANKDVLTTPFDVYQTLLDILNPPKDVTTLQDTANRALSLLRPIPKTRTCEEADIEPHWCTCLQWQNASTTAAEVQQTKLIAEALTTAIDRQLAPVRNLCAPVTLKKVISASKLTPNSDLLNYKTAKDLDGFVPEFNKKATARAAFALYQLKIMTSPNDAVYEATVYFDGRNASVEVDLQSLSHVSSYGDDPHCVVQKFNTLALYCVCYDRIKQ